MVFAQNINLSENNCWFEVGQSEFKYPISQSVNNLAGEQFSNFEFGKSVVRVSQIVHFKINFKSKVDENQKDVCNKKKHYPRA